MIFTIIISKINMEIKQNYYVRDKAREWSY